MRIFLALIIFSWFLSAPQIVLASELLAQPMIDDSASLDPWEPFNRRIFYFNKRLDQYVLRPAARWYASWVPDSIARSVTHFFNNLGETTTITNQVLQAKWKPAGQTGERFLINTSAGLLGFFDVATRWGIPQHDEDFGQTLGYWGISSGPYLVLPVLGPSSMRDTVGLAPQYFITDPTVFVSEPARFELYGLNVVQARAKLLSADVKPAGDEYVFLREVYFQRRAFLIQDGQIKDQFLDDNW